MDIFKTHAQIINDYATYIRSFLNISDAAIRTEVETALSQGKLWPSPLLQFNPSFEIAGDVGDLASQGVVHAAFRDIFRDAKSGDLT